MFSIIIFKIMIYNHFPKANTHDHPTMPRFNEKKTP